MNKWLRGTNAAVLSLAVVGIFIVATIFLNSLSGLQWDLSANKKFTLSEKTVETLNKLDKDIKITAFTGVQSQNDTIMNRDVMDLLRQYQKRSGKISLEEIDPIKEPARAQQYQIDQLGTLVFESGGKQKKVYTYELFAAGSAQGSYAFSGEEKFTQAIVSLTSDVTHPVYFLTGHGELAANQTSAFRSSLEGEGYVIKDLNLFKEGKIPDDAETIFILGPQNDLNESETKLLKEYVQGKGKLYVAYGYAKDVQKFAQLDELIAAVNVKNTKAVALENSKSILNDPLTIVPGYGSHPITESLSAQDRVTILPIAMALQTDTANADYRASALLRTSNQAYGETDLAGLTAGKSGNDSSDVKGPLDLAYAVQNKEDKPKAFVIGSFQFLTDSLINQQGNRDFALNSLGWLQEQAESVTIRPREQESVQQAFIMPNQANWIFYGTVIGFPLLFLAAGTAVWWRRRKG